MSLVRSKPLLAILLLAGLLLALPPVAADDGAPMAAFEDVTASSGITFRHNTGAFGKKWLPETMGSGVVVVDYNRDGLMDLLFLNGTRFAGQEGRSTTQSLWRNQGGFRFRDVTREAGLAIEAFCMGGAAGDLDNDGDADLYLSCLGQDFLLVNEAGVFKDHSAAGGLPRDYEFGASVALLDADHDGLLDIFATRYVTWTAETDIRCSLDGRTKSYCTPEPYPGASPRFLRNRGDLRFEDRTKIAGIWKPDAKSLGVAVLDVEGDGWPDIAVANDTQPNLLYLNQGDGTFAEQGVPSGMAFSETGTARGGMGIDAADFNRSGRPSLLIGNFANEMTGLYQNEGHLLFVDVAPAARIGRPTLRSLTFATFFFDYDLDGTLDIFAANGHLEKEIETIQTGVAYAQPCQLFRGVGKGRFEEKTAGDLAEPRVGRGAAWADFDRDGRPDVVVTTNGGPPTLFANRLETRGHWLQVDLEGKSSNRDGLGAVVELKAGGSTRSSLVKAGSSYLSQSQLSPIFGLGNPTEVESLIVRWPSGVVQTVDVPGIDRVLRVVESEADADRPSPPPNGR